jgi:hypothetical protein
MMVQPEHALFKFINPVIALWGKRKTLVHPTWPGLPVLGQLPLLKPIPALVNCSLSLKSLGHALPAGH